MSDLKTTSIIVKQVEQTYQGTPETRPSWFNDV